MNRLKNTPVYSFIILILLGFIWGTGYAIARFAMTNGVPPLGYSFWQSIGPAIVIGLIALARYSPNAVTLNSAKFYLVTGLTGIVIPNTTMYFAASHLPAGILAMIVNTVPVFAYPMALAARLEKFNIQRVIGILIAFSAIMMIIIPKSSLPSPTLIPWVMTTLLTPLSFAFCSIYITRYRPKQSNIISLSAGMLLFSSILLIPLVFYAKSFYWLHLPLTTPDKIILLEITLSSIGYLLFFYLLKIAGPVFYSLVDTIVVLTGLFWSYVIFGEVLNQWTGMAVCLIVIALLLVTQQQRKAARMNTR